ncbi:MAG: tetratricopeptide (TPR) repeat protein [Verrucomicrobiales bacterium]
MATISGTIFGTPQFMAPEQAIGETRLMDRRTDVYALGAILYNILTLHPPVDGKTIDEVLKKVSSGEVQTPTSYNTKKQPKRVTEVRGLPEQRRLYHCPNERIPEALAAITMKAMAVKQDNRYQSVSGLLGDIEKFQGGFATSAEEAGAMKLLALFVKRNKFATISVFLIALLGVGFVGKTISSERQIRAVSRKAAPKFVDEARAAFANSDDAAALESIETATGLDQQLPDAWFELARIKLAEFEFQEAIKALDQAASVSKDAAEQGRAWKYREIAARWKTETAENGVLPESIINLAAEIEPFDSVLASRIYSRTGDETKAMQLRVIAALGALEAANPGLEMAFYSDGKLTTSWIHFQYEGGVSLDFHHSGRKELVNIGPLAGLPMSNLELFTHPVSDLTPLEEMPIRRLILDGTQVVGLTSLRDMPIEELNISRTQVTDLEPLRGRPLKKLTISGTKVADLGPLQGAPLEELHAADCPELNSLAPLRGLPIKSLSLQRTGAISDFSPLEGMPLEVLTLENQEVRDLDMVRDAPLRQLLINNCPIEDLSALRGKNFEVLKLQNLPVNDYSPLLEVNAVDLNFHDQRLTNLDPLKSFTALQRADFAVRKLESLEALRGLPIETLTLIVGDQLTSLAGLEGMPLKQATLTIPAVADLSPLRGLELEHFEASGAFTDISPIAGPALKRVELTACPNLVDLSPLAQCKELEEVVVSKNAGNLEFLLELPKLRTVSYSDDHQDPAEFIREHGDGQPSEN